MYIFNITGNSTVEVAWVPTMDLSIKVCLQNLKWPISIVEHTIGVKQTQLNVHASELRKNILN